MCGLVGAVAARNISPMLIEGLKRLEYRGYDSAGLALANGDRLLHVHRCVGKVGELEQYLKITPHSGSHGIGHTRWATHGAPVARNAHPLVSNDQVAVVHNGIIENHSVLRVELQQDGYLFSSDTDTEVVAHLVHHQLQDEATSLFEAVARAVRQLSGAYAIAAVATTEPDCLVVARCGSSLVIGLGDGEQFVASDAATLLPWTRRFIYLEDGDVAELRRDGLRITDAEGRTVRRVVKTLSLPETAANKGRYRHYMLKEICEQPKALRDTLEGRVRNHRLLAPYLGFRDAALLERIQEVQIVACGTSHYASEVGRYWIESLAALPCRTELASEYRYRTPVVPTRCLFIVVSQSGETADTLAALRFARKAGYLATLAICNAPESALTREADLMLLTRAGPEIGVASTKAFTTQLLAMLMLAVLLSRRRDPEAETESRIVGDLLGLEQCVEQVLKLKRRIKTLAGRFADQEHALVLGRGPMYPIAREAALKLKETSYLHAEAYAGGELKHGPLALVDRHMPVLALAPDDAYLDKFEANIEEVRARGGRLYVFTDRERPASSGVTTIRMPRVPKTLAPIVYGVAMQLLAYYVAVAKGTDVDQPRNLAKTVTVE